MDLHRMQDRLLLRVEVILPLRVEVILPLRVEVILHLRLEVLLPKNLEVILLNIVEGLHPLRANHLLHGNKFLDPTILPHAIIMCTVDL